MAFFQSLLKLSLILVLLAVPIKLKHHQIYIDIDDDITADIKCLADNIYHEAKGESIKGKFGVAQVTINRLNSEEFPSNVCDVVYERSKRVCQFSWVCKGLQPNLDEHYEDALNIAYAVLINDAEYNILKGSLYFHADYIKPKWKKRPITKIGKHIFY